MAITSRSPLAKVIPLLSPPFVIPLRSLRWLNSRHVIPFDAAPARCRSLHLYKTARAKTVLGQHKVLPFEIYDIPDPETSDHRIDLLEEPGGKKIAEDLTLEQVYNDHIKPGHMLYMSNQLPPDCVKNMDKLKDEDFLAGHRSYSIVKAHSTPAYVNPKTLNKITKPGGQYFNQLASLREVHLLLKSPIEYVKIMLDKTYRFIEGGAPVEFDLRWSTDKGRKKLGYSAMPMDRWPWLHDHFPHLRPDFILKAMPEGTIYLVRPVTDGNHVQWVMALPTRAWEQQGSPDYTRRLFKVKQAVQQSMEEGRQPNLPQSLRQKQIKKGTPVMKTIHRAGSMIQDQRETTNR